MRAFPKKHNKIYTMYSYPVLCQFRYVHFPCSKDFFFHVQIVFLGVVELSGEIIIIFWDKTSICSQTIALRNTIFNYWFFFTTNQYFWIKNIPLFFTIKYKMMETIGCWGLIDASSSLCSVARLFERSHTRSRADLFQVFRSTFDFIPCKFAACQEHPGEVIIIKRPEGATTFCFQSLVICVRLV